MRPLTVLLYPAAFLLFACVAPQQRTVDVSLEFDEAQARLYDAGGTGTITGQAFLRQAGGGVVTCAGETVSLGPADAYVRAAVRAAASGARVITANAHDRFPRAYPKATCNAQGDFRFEGLYPGEYQAATVVRWMVGNIPQGAFVAETVAVGPGEKVEVLLSDADRVSP